MAARSDPVLACTVDTCRGWLCCLWCCAGDFPGAGDAVHRSAAQQLQQQVSVTTAPAIMALARQQDNKPLQDHCVEVMSAHRKNDVYGVLDFALRFNLRSLQGSCLGSIRRQSRDRLVDKADRIMQVTRRTNTPLLLCCASVTVAYSHLECIRQC